MNWIIFRDRESNLERKLSPSWDIIRQPCKYWYILVLFFMRHEFEVAYTPVQIGTVWICFSYVICQNTPWPSKKSQKSGDGMSAHDMEWLEKIGGKCFLFKEACDRRRTCSSHNRHDICQIFRSNSGWMHSNMNSLCILFCSFPSPFGRFAFGSWSNVKWGPTPTSIRVRYNFRNAIADTTSDASNASMTGGC